MNAPVLVTYEGRVAIVTLNAPERRNAISTAMRKQMLAVFDELLGDPRCGAVVLTGAGAAFCSGGDISEMNSAKATAEGGGSRLEILHDVIRRMAFGGKPFVAAVEGAAAGAGMSLATICDCVVAAENARFIGAFARMGLIADCGLLWSLPRRIGPVKALDLLMSACVVTGVEAGAIGLADIVVSPGDSLRVAVERANAYLAAAPLSLRAVRAQLRGSPDELDAVLSQELKLQATLRESYDHQEARTAFLEKRSPIFQSR